MQYNKFMIEQDKKEIRQIFNEGLQQLVLPILDDIYKNIGDIRGNMATKEDLKSMATKQDLEGVKEDIAFLQTDVDSINRKLDAEIGWRDSADKRIKKAEVKLGLVE